MPEEQLARRGSDTPWKRMPGEPEDAYEAFCCFRDMPLSERTYRAVANSLNYTEAVIRAWADEWQWTDRAAALMLATQKAVPGDLVALQKDVIQRHQSMSARMFELIRLKTESLINTPMPDVKTRDISMLASALTLIQRQERISAGLPCDSIRPSGPSSSAQAAVVVDSKLFEAFNKFKVDYQGDEGLIDYVES